MDNITIIYGTNVAEMTYALLRETVAGKRLKVGMNVVIKPNLVVAKPASEGATTHPEVVEGNDFRQAALQANSRLVAVTDPDLKLVVVFSADTFWCGLLLYDRQCYGMIMLSERFFDVLWVLIIGDVL